MVPSEYTTFTDFDEVFMLFTFSLLGYALAIAALFITFPRVKKNAASIAICVIAFFVSDFNLLQIIFF